MFGFLPIALFLYYICGIRAKSYILAAASLLFYACGSSEYFLLLNASMVINIFLAYLVGGDYTARGKKVTALIIGICYNVGILVYYKYDTFIGENIAALVGKTYASREMILPLGLSFFVFKAISYLVDVYRGMVEVDKSPIVALNYLCFFGQMEAGPLSRYSDIKKGLKIAPSDENIGVQAVLFKNILPGGERFAIGLIKKTLISNVLYNIVSEVFETSSSQASPALLWLGSISYSLQLFFDFSGYSDMSIGVSQMFGIGCPENFIYPYITKSISEFWRRWHVTLGTWFKDYVYIPMGGSRVSRLRLYLNLLVVWLLTGLWHGANWTFVVWGLSYFVFIALEKRFDIPNHLNILGQILYRIICLIIINFEWVIFRSDSIQSAWIYIRGMFVSVGYTAANSRALFLFKDYAVFIVAAILFSMPVVPKLKEFCGMKKTFSVVYSIASAIIVASLFIWSVSFIVAGANNPFVYANF